MTEGALKEEWIGEVLDFWFRQLSQRDKFAKSDSIDADIGRRFGDLYDRLARELPAPASARGALAAIIVLDQFPRNMFRGSAKAFATDGAALALSEAAIEQGFDRALSAEERQFLYMPFQHSEDRAIQARSVDLFARLGDADVLEYARRHCEIIERFGRFPHRNPTLGRESTEEETRFLEEPGSSF